MIKSGIESDVWRYYLLSIRPEKGDSNFTMEGLKQTAELLRKDISNLGKLIVQLFYL